MSRVGNQVLEAVQPVLSPAAEPFVLPVPHGAAKVMPRWAEEDEVVRWRLKYRCGEPDEPDASGEDGTIDDDHNWTEMELRGFTRELPLTGLTIEQPHYFKVALETPRGWSGWSRLVGCTPPAPSPPGKCAGVFASVKDATTAVIRWTRPCDFAVAAECGSIRRYRLLISWHPQGSEDESGNREIVIDEDASCYEVAGLGCEREYHIQVAAENAAGWGEYSDPSPALVMPPPVPSRLPPPTLRRAMHHSVVVQWHHPDDIQVPIESFRFRYTTSEDFSHSSGVQELHGISPDIAQMTVEGLRPGQPYLFQVRALNRYGMGIWSDASLPLRTLDPSEPSKITGLSAPYVHRTFIMLQWTPAEPNGFEVTGHVLRSANRPDMTDAVEVVPEVVKKNGVDTCNIRHLRKTQYYFQVAASNRLGTSEWSDPLAVDLAVPFKLEDA